MSLRILHGDMREKLAGLADCSIDSIITDPPYHLTTGKKGGSGPHGHRYYCRNGCGSVAYTKDTNERFIERKQPLWGWCWQCLVAAHEQEIRRAGEKAAAPPSEAPAT